MTQGIWGSLCCQGVMHQWLDRDDQEAASGVHGKELRLLHVRVARPGRAGGPRPCAAYPGMACACAQRVLVEGHDLCIRTPVLPVCNVSRALPRYSEALVPARAGWAGGALAALEQPDEGSGIILQCSCPVRARIEVTCGVMSTRASAQSRVALMHGVH